MAQDELKELIGHTKIINNNKNLMLANDELKSFGERMNTIVKRLKGGGTITNVEYLDYLQNLKAIAETNNNSRILGLTKDDVDGINNAANATKKSIDLASYSGSELVENRGEIIRKIRLSGKRNLREFDAAKVLGSTMDRNTRTVARAFGNLPQSPMALEAQHMEIIFDKRPDIIAKKAMDDIFHAESVVEMIDRRIGKNLSDRVATDKNLSRFADAESFSRLGGFGVIGMAAIGFIGAFAISSNRRSWLGPTAGYGGEYSERQSRKDEEAQSKQNVLQRLRTRNIPIGTNVPDIKEARLMPDSIQAKRGPSLRELVGELGRNRDMPRPLEYGSY
jgi:hypothetical protein